MGIFISKEDAQKIIDKLTELEQFVYNFAGQDSQADFTTIQTVLGQEGIVVPMLPTGMTQDLIAKHEGNFVKIVDAVKRIIARLNNLPLPADFAPTPPTPVAPATPAPAPTA